MRSLPIVVILACTVACKKTDAGEADAGGAVTAAASSAQPAPIAPPSLPMVHIPAGTLLTGDRAARKKIPVAAFDIDVTEVTVDAYTTCVQAGVCPAPRQTAHCNYGVADKSRHPINCLKGSEAAAFCKWVGGRLPTETEWEYAARGTDGRDYPWGNQPPGMKPCWKQWDEDKKTGGTCVAGSFPDDKSSFGVLDMAGNVSEWTSTLDEGGDEKLPVIRGASWYTSDARHETGLLAAANEGLTTASITYRQAVTDWGGDTIGFRCAK